jgi:hypothetical protein
MNKKGEREVRSRQEREFGSVYRFNHSLDLSKGDLRATKGWDDGEKVF